MGKDPFHIVQGSTHVPQATGEDSLAEINSKEHLARSNVVTAREEQAKIDKTEQEARGSEPAKGTAEGDLFLNIATELTGMKIISAAVEIIDDRVSKAHTQPLSRTMDDDVTHSAQRNPGFYTAQQTPNVYATQQAQTAGNQPQKPHSINGSDLFARANIARMSLNDQDGSAIQSWGVPSQKLGSVAATKKLVFGQELANEQALDGIKLAREHNAVMRQRVEMAAPGLGMAMGPSMRPADMARVAEEEAALNRWRSGSDTWSGGTGTA